MTRLRRSPRQRRRGAREAANRFVASSRDAIERQRHLAGRAVRGQHAQAGLPASPRAGAPRRGRLGGGRVLLGRRARRPAGPPGVELRRRLLRMLISAAPERAARPGPPHAGRGARPRRGRAHLRDRAPARLRCARRRATRLRSHLARDGRGRPHRQPLPGLAGPRRAERWVVADLGAGPKAWRMTLTFPVLNAGPRVVFVVDRSRQGRCAARDPGRRHRTFQRPASTARPVRVDRRRGRGGAGGLTDAALDLADHRDRGRHRRLRRRRGRHGAPIGSRRPRHEHRALPGLARPRVDRPGRARARG